VKVVVTATDTGAGKTRFCQLLVRALKKNGESVVGLKPFATGSREDAECLAAAMGDGTLAEALNPSFFARPAAPLAAALEEGATVDFDGVLEFVWEKAGNFDHVVVEGVGGWLVPLTRGLTWADFTVALGWPVLVVAPNRLGVLNHTALTCASMAAAGCPADGVVLNRIDETSDSDAESNRRLLEEEFGLPVLGEIPLGAEKLPPELELAVLEAVR